MTSVPALALGVCILVCGALAVVILMFIVALGGVAKRADEAEARQIHARRARRPDIHARREGAQLVSLDVRRRHRENVHVWDR